MAFNNYIFSYHVLPKAEKNYNKPQLITLTPLK